jgi:hypothetical protein
MRTSTQYALAAALATTLMGGSAYAADLGGNCCADLEERVAELEATTVRKGNRKVSVQLSGFVSHNVIWWDDGTQSDTYIADGGNYGSRWRVRGDAKINPQLTAGFLYEFQNNSNGVQALNQLNGGDDLGFTGAAGAAANQTTGVTVLRDSTVWLRHNQLGMVKIGHGSTATDNLVLIDLGGTTGAATSDIALYNGGFILRSNAGLLADGAGGGTTPATNVNWAQAIRGHESWDTSRRNHVLYETPTLHGFNVQTAVAEDNYWDIALRYAGEFNGIRIAAGIGYQVDTEFNGPNSAAAGMTGGALCTANCDVKATDLKGSASVLHVPTGLFATFAGGRRELEGSNANSVATTYTGPDLKFWYLSGGIARNFFGIGNTVLFGEISNSQGGLEQAAFLGTTSNVGYTLNVGGVRTTSEVDHWGLGITQYVDAAAMEVYAAYKNYSLDATGFAGANVTLNRGDSGVHDISVFLVGTRINF